MQNHAFRFSYLYKNNFLVIRIYSNARKKKEATFVSIQKHFFGHSYLFKNKQKKDQFSYLYKNSFFGFQYLYKNKFLGLFVYLHILHMCLFGSATPTSKCEGGAKGRARARPSSCMRCGVQFFHEAAFSARGSILGTRQHSSREYAMAAGSATWGKDSALALQGAGRASFIRG